jgi:hypothetical protein
MPSASASRSTCRGSLELGKRKSSWQPTDSKAATYWLTVSASLAAEPAMKSAVCQLLSAGARDGVGETDRDLHLKFLPRVDPGVRQP